MKRIIILLAIFVAAVLQLRADKVTAMVESNSEPMRIPQYAEEYLDFSSGLRVSKDFDSSEDGYTCRVTEDGLLEIEIDGVFIFKDEAKQPNRELWFLKGGSDVYSKGGPALPELLLKLPAPVLSTDKQYNFELVESEYVEYKDIECFDEILRSCVVDWS